MKHRNVNAVSGVNRPCSAAAEVVPRSTVSVEITLSLAMRPHTSAVDARQSPNPSGAKMGAIRPPSIASMLCD